MNVLIVDRQLPFAELASRLRADGWERNADPIAPPPLVAGEPENVEWRRADSRLHYHFEPATGLRELRLSGAQAEEAARTLAAKLPCHGIERARDLLGAPGLESKLLALCRKTHKTDRGQK